MAPTAGLEAAARATRRPPTRLDRRARPVAGHRAAAGHPRPPRPGAGAPASCGRRSSHLHRSVAAHRHRHRPSTGCCAAIARRERIVVHGDYDVDGVTSTVILRRALELLGADVTHFIPERLRDGYGLQPATIDRLHADGAQGDRVGRLRHPRPRGGAAGHASSASTSSSPTTTSPTASCRGAGRGQPEARRLPLSRQAPGRRRRGAEGRAGAVPEGRPRGWLTAFVKIAAIGTLADVVPLVGENRVIAKLGLEHADARAAQGRPAGAARRRRAWPARPSTPTTSPSWSRRA